MALARQLHAHGWVVRVLTRTTERIEEVPEQEIEIVPVLDLSPASLEKVGAGRAQAFVALMRNEENLEICQAAYERFGTQCG